MVSISLNQLLSFLLTTLWIIQTLYEEYILGESLQRTNIKNTKLAPELSHMANGYSLI